MRTTVESPDPLMRERKAREPLAAGRPSRSQPPVIKREGARPMPAMSNARLNALLDAEDAAKVLPLAKAKPKGRALQG